MCKALNICATGVPAGAVYVGPGTIWRNPFVIGRDGDRDTVMPKHERWLADQHELLRQ